MEVGDASETQAMQSYAFRNASIYGTLSVELASLYSQCQHPQLANAGDKCLPIVERALQFRQSQLGWLLNAVSVPSSFSIMTYRLHYRGSASSNSSSDISMDVLIRINATMRINATVRINVINRIKLMLLFALVETSALMLLLLSTLMCSTFFFRQVFYDY